MSEVSLLTGAMVGISIAAPFGPSSMLCVERALNGGLASGLACGFGVATVHLAYGMLVSLGGLTLLAVTQGNLGFALMSSLALLLFAFRSLTKVAVLEPLGRPQVGLAATYLGALAFGLFNPLTPVMFAAMSPVLLTSGPSAGGWAIAGVFFGSLAWWSVLTAAICCFRGNLPPGLMRLSNKAAGVLLAAMAVMITLRTWLGTA
ncbi:LysE family transporter [Rhizobium sp.]